MGGLIAKDRSLPDNLMLWLNEYFPFDYLLYYKDNFT